MRRIDLTRGWSAVAWHHWRLISSIWIAVVGPRRRTCRRCRAGVTQYPSRSVWRSGTARMRGLLSKRFKSLKKGSPTTKGWKRRWMRNSSSCWKGFQTCRRQISPTATVKTTTEKCAFRVISRNLRLSQKNISTWAKRWDKWILAPQPVCPVPASSC